MRSSLPSSRGFRLQVVDTNELENPDYAKNDGTRCFHCKDELFKVMEQVGGPLRFTNVAYGMNVDDRGRLPARAEGRGES